MSAAHNAPAEPAASIVPAQSDDIAVINNRIDNICGSIMNMQPAEVVLARAYENMKKAIEKMRIRLERMIKNKT